MTATVGHNSGAFLFSEDELRLRVWQVEKFLRVISVLTDTPKKTILERRKSGVRGRSLRRLGIHFANFLGLPQDLQKRIFLLDRKQLGQEEVAISKRLEADPGADWAVGKLFGAMGDLFSIDWVDVFELASEPPQSAVSVDAEIAAEIPVEEERPKPKPKARAATRTSSPAVEAALLRNDLTRRLRDTESDIRIAKAVIMEGGKPNATRTQKDDAKREVVKLDALVAKEKALRAKLKKLEAKGEAG